MGQQGRHSAVTGRTPASSGKPSKNLRIPAATEKSLSKIAAKYQYVGLSNRSDAGNRMNTRNSREACNSRDDTNRRDGTNSRDGSSSLFPGD